MSYSISGRTIDRKSPPFIIAEMSGNHRSSLERALQIVEAASMAGADAIKLQTYTADTITLNVRGGSFEISDPNSLWKGNNLHDLYDSAHTPWDWHHAIIKRANDLGLICFSSPFDESAVDFLESLNMPAYKIASFENNHLPLIPKAASTGKPLIISTGMASLTDLELAVNTARSAGCKQLILLKCTSTYPSLPKYSNIRTIPYLRDLFDCEVGLSDHSRGVGVAVASIALGASVIEKHLTLDRGDGAVDSAFSLEPDEFSLLVKEAHNAWASLGDLHFGLVESEISSALHRRSIYVSEDIKAGDLFTEKNIRIVRPGDGLSPRYYQKLLGLRSRSSLAAGTPLTFEVLF